MQHTKEQNESCSYIQVPTTLTFNVSRSIWGKNKKKTKRIIFFCSFLIRNSSAAVWCDHFKQTMAIHILNVERYVFCLIQSLWVDSRHVVWDFVFLALLTFNLSLFSFFVVSSYWYLFVNTMYDMKYTNTTDPTIIECELKVFITLQRFQLFIIQILFVNFFWVMVVVYVMERNIVSCTTLVHAPS